MSICQDCKTTFDLEDGGFIWNELAFCEQHDPEEENA